MENLPTKPAETSKVVKRSRDQHRTENALVKRSKVEAVPLRLSDINFDCMEAICNYLNVQDLVAISDVHTHFVSAAATAFVRHYGRKCVYLNLCSLHHNEDDCIEINKEIAGAFFHHFGQLISTLYLDCMAQREVAIEKALLQYCTGSLVKLELTMCRVNAFATINKPFEKVQQLGIVKSWLGPQLSQLNVWFPNVINLKLDRVKFTSPTTLAVHFPQLKHLAINDNDETIPLSTLNELLRLNPQLESLILQCDYDYDFLHSINEHLPQLTKLAISSPEDRFRCFADQKMHFENVNKFTLSAYSYRGDFVVNIPFVFPCLKELNFDGFNEFNGTMLNFILQNKLLTKLSLMTSIDEWDDLTIDDLKMIVDTLPELIELEFCADTFTVDELNGFLSQSKQLQKVRLTFNEFPGCPHLQAALNVNWTIDTYAVEVHCTVECVQSEYFYLNLQRKN